MSNSYTAVPAIIPGPLTVNGLLTVNSNQGIRIGAAIPFGRLYIGPNGNFGVSENLGTDESTKDIGSNFGHVLYLDSTANSPAFRHRTPAGTDQFTGVDRAIVQDGAPVSHTGDVLETTLKTRTIPANMIGQDGALIVEALFDPTVQGGVASTFRIRFGGVTIASGNSAVVSGVWLRAVMHNRDLTNSQMTFSLSFSNTTLLQALSALSAVDTTVDQNLTITFQGGAATDNWTVRGWRVYALGTRASAF